MKAGREELTRPVGQLAWPGVAGGLLMGRVCLLDYEQVETSAEAPRPPC